MLAKPSNSHEVIDLMNIDDVDFSFPLQYLVTPILNIGQCMYPWATCMWNNPLVLKKMDENCPIVEFPASVSEPEFPPPIMQAPDEKSAVWGACHRVDTQEWAQISAEWEVALTAWEEQQIRAWLQEQREAEERKCVERAAREKAEKEKEKEEQCQAVTHAASSTTMQGSMSTAVKKSPHTTQSGGKHKSDSSKWLRESTSPITHHKRPRAKEEMEADTECEGCTARGKACQCQVETTSGQVRLIAGPSKNMAGLLKKRKEKAPGLLKSKPSVEDLDVDFVGEEDPAELG
ncbi:hypothetical protein Moror_12170 [Moniliophthora roreri MCA 2997]|uniref:Uncharacterized protein n=1 Tax=Moniliophthora roreri (strain MCA 2997) TaxID=1381753 RepID=V2XSJ0_MONRO|nr:hypothetical protein Moror_12170 [Moniliophthora roreri MCA 2997]